MKGYVRKQGFYCKLMQRKRPFFIFFGTHLDGFIITDGPGKQNTGVIGIVKKKGVII